MLVYLQMIEGPEERSKFEQVYTTYRGLMFYVAQKILGNDQDAEDAVHDAFVAIANKIKKISAPECHKTKAYVVTIVENKAIDLYRRKQRYSSGGLSEELVGMTVEYDGDDELARCMLKLPARYRNFLLLKYDQGYTNRELEKILGLSSVAVRKLDQRAKEQLEALCREECLL